MKYCFNFDPRHILIEPNNDPQKPIIDKIWLPILTELDDKIIS